MTSDSKRRRKEGWVLERKGMKFWKTQKVLSWRVFWSKDSWETWHGWVGEICQTFGMVTPPRGTSFHGF